MSRMTRHYHSFALENWGSKGTVALSGYGRWLELHQLGVHSRPSLGPLSFGRQVSGEILKFQLLACTTFARQDRHIFLVQSRVQ